jgi:hypothetical protein
MPSEFIAALVPFSLAWFVGPVELGWCTKYVMNYLEKHSKSKIELAAHLEEMQKIRAVPSRIMGIYVAGSLARLFVPQIGPALFFVDWIYLLYMIRKYPKEIYKMLKRKLYTVLVA